VVANCGVGGMTASDCQTYRESQCEQGAIVMPFPGSGSALQRTYTSGNVKACIDALNSAFTPDSSGVNTISFSQLFGSGNLVDTCEAVFVGSAGNGATCTTKYDCTASGETCAPVLGESMGQCATPTTKMLGDACADPGDTCSSGTYCQSTAGGLPKCVAALATGTACDSTDQCAATDHCAGSVCTALSGPGGACGSNADCDPNQDPLCDLYAGGECEKGLILGGGSYDCKGFLFGIGVSDGGTSTPTPEAGADAPSGD
jgi:hypothetical protein